MPRQTLFLSSILRQVLSILQAGPAKFFPFIEIPAAEIGFLKFFRSSEVLVIFFLLSSPLV